MPQLRIAVVLVALLLAGAARAATVQPVDAQQCQLPAGCVDINTALIPDINAALSTIAPGQVAGLYADPRDHGATCGSGDGAATWNQNNSTNDDAPGINAALATGLPVVIPLPGCKLVTQVTFTGNGQTLFSFGGGGPYDALGNAAQNRCANLKTPCLYVPNAATGAANKCMIDYQGWDGDTIRNITMIGENEFNGIAAICNSVGIRDSYPAAFLFLENVAIAGMAGIGTATDGTCAPSGTLSSNVFQVRFYNLTIAQSCFGFYANLSDVHGSSFIGDNIYNSCIDGPTGISIEINNGRCEYTGHFDANPAWKDGTAVWFTGSGQNHLSNWVFDHTFGACITFDGGGGWSDLSNIQCKDAVQGGPARLGGPIVNACNYVFANDSSFITMLGISAQSFTTHTDYDLCFTGTASGSITIVQSDGGGPNLGGGWSQAFTNGTLPSQSHIEAANWGVYDSRLPASCSGQPTNAIRSNSGVLTLCP